MTKIVVVDAAITPQFYPKASPFQTFETGLFTQSLSATSESGVNSHELRVHDVFALIISLITPGSGLQVKQVS
jgi:hypothetical protein